VGRPQNVETVDLLSISSGHGPRDSSIPNQALIENLALGRTEFFRIIETGTGKPAGQNDRRRHHRPGERTTARLIDASDAPEATGV
jgi:hypothetical protein